MFPSPLQALRVSMEEQRQRQEEEARRAAAASAAEAGIPATGGDGKSSRSALARCGLKEPSPPPKPGLSPFFSCVSDSDDALLKMTIGQQEFGRAGLPDLSTMTEEEQIAYAMQMSLQGAGERGAGGSSQQIVLHGHPSSRAGKLDLHLLSPSSFCRVWARRVGGGRELG